MFANAVKRVPVKKEAIQPRITFTLDEVSILLRLPDPEKRLGFRDQVLLNLMYANGARAQEICDLKVRDFVVEKNLYKLTITRKGNKTRRVMIARTEHPEMFLEKHYTPHTMSNPNFWISRGIRPPHICWRLGCRLWQSKIFSDILQSPQRNGAELSQGTVNRHIRDWSEKWFSHQKENPVTQKKENQLPDFLKQLYHYPK